MVDDTSFDLIEYMPDVELLINHKGNFFDGKAFQIWSDGKITRKICREGVPLFTPNKQVVALIREATRQKYWREGNRFFKLFQIETIENKVIASSKKGRPGNSQETTLTELTTNIGKLWVAAWEWGTLGEDGDAGDETELFETEQEARAKYKEFSSR